MSTPEKTAADLEWSALVDQLAQRCTSDAGAANARALGPDPELAGARLRMRRTAEALALNAQGHPIPVHGIVALGDFVSRLARGAVATAQELHALRLLLRTAHTLRRFASTYRDTHPALADALHSEPILDRLLETLEFAIGADGGLADRASADLAHARRKAGEMRQRVIARLDELIVRYAEVLQDRYYTVRDGRYVLPVRSDAHIRVPGIVLGSSASGATLFIEPRAVMSLGNQLKVAMADVEREEARMLVELSDRARHQVSAIERAWQACLDADLLAATVRLAQDMNAIAVEPDAECGLELREMRHPLLALGHAAVVPNDLSLRAGQVLVISGPNAGGKTVALKCLGLAAMMVRSGLALPVAEGSRAGWFSSVLSDVGDDQSLVRSLSTFSAHVSNLKSMIETAERGTLVLLDELAGGTDPEEGSALAAAVLDRLASCGAAVAVTTHYELLKTLPVRDERFVNASVGFDMVAMMPTFRVSVGIPGASSALAVASRFGIPTEVIERARDMLPKHSVDREGVLRRIHDEQVAAQMARQAAEDDARATARLRSEIEAERNLQRARDGAKVGKEAQELLAALRKAREELRAAQARIAKKAPTRDDLRDAERAIDAVAQQVALGGALSVAVRLKPEEATARRAAVEDELRPGMRGYVARIGSYVEVVDRPSRGHVRVAAGPLKLFVAVDDLLVDEECDATAVAASAPTKPAKAGGSAHAMEQVYVAPVRTDGNTCDVRGLRSDDALTMVDVFLDRMFGDGSDAGFVLHGHGTGALKLAVREHLRNLPHVARSQAAALEDGGDAFTVLWLRE